MASPSARHPLPALLSLAALVVLTALVWWRVIHRDDQSRAATPCHTPSPSSCSAPTGAGAGAATTFPAPGRVSVQVLNSTQRTGIAGKARTALVHAGFHIPGDADNDPSSRVVSGVAEIRYDPAGKRGAALLHYYLPGATLVAHGGHGATVVVSLGKKYADVSSAAKVQAALRNAHAGVSAAPSTAVSSTPASTTASTSAPASNC